MTKEKNINALISKVVSGNATGDEISKFDDWLADSEINQKTYQASVKVWKALGTRLAFEEIQQDKMKVITRVNRDLVIRSRENRRRSVVYLVAAILAFPIALALGLFFFSDSITSNNDLAIWEVSAPAGQISKCKLPDGTAIWINSGSKITYNSTSFIDGDREVVLDGEAFFDVTKNKMHPFYVRTTMAVVRVTGTSFNVKAYSDSELFETVLNEGSIELEINKELKNQKVELKPGERAFYEVGQNELLVQKVDAQIYSAWRSGQIIFKDATLDDLVKALERVYEVKFRFANSDLRNYRFRGTFSYKNNLIDALESFKVTAKINYRIENKEVWLMKE